MSYYAIKFVENYKDNEYNEEDVVYIFTDGACSNNGKLNAVAGIGIYFGEDDKRNVSKKIDGKQTNNTAELCAIIEAIKIISAEKCEKKIVICSDSEYSIYCATGYGKKLELNNWKLKKGKEPLNIDLVKEIYYLSNKYNISYNYVKGHTVFTDFFSNGNRQADLLANKSIECSEEERIKRDAISKIYLEVPYKNKEVAKSFGAKWCPEEKLWYYINNIEKEKEDKLLELFKIVYN